MSRKSTKRLERYLRIFKFENGKIVPFTHNFDVILTHEEKE